MNSPYASSESDASSKSDALGVLRWLPNPTSYLACFDGGRGDCSVSERFLLLSVSSGAFSVCALVLSRCCRRAFTWLLHLRQTALASIVVLTASRKPPACRSSRLIYLSHSIRLSGTLASMQALGSCRASASICLSVRPCVVSFKEKRSISAPVSGSPVRNVIAFFDLLSLGIGAR